VINGVILRESR